MKFIVGVISGLLLAGSAFPATPTFNKDVAPILYQNCAVCHRPGEVAPFPLLTYSDASRRAALIAAVTAKHYMPPWKAEAGYGHFQDERRLTDAQIATIAASARNGAPEGDPRQKPVPPQFASGWQAGKPDAVLTMPQPFQIAADGRDVFRCFVIPLNSAEDRYVKNVEFHPGNPRVVHHALFFLDTSGEARQRETATPGMGYPCFGGPQITPAGALGGWAPGATPEPLPVGVAQTVPKDSDLVIQIHYHPSGKPETDQSSIGLTFGEPPRKGLAGMLAGTRQIDLAPGEAHPGSHRLGIRAGRCRPDRHYPARTPVVQRDEGGCAAPRRDNQAPHLDQGLGLQLAGPISLRRASPFAERDTHRDALFVRQLVGQSAQPVESAQTGDLRRTNHRRNGSLFCRWCCHGRQRCPNSGKSS